MAPQNVPCLCTRLGLVKPLTRQIGGFVNSGVVFRTVSKCDSSAKGVGHLKKTTTIHCLSGVEKIFFCDADQLVPEGRYKQASNSLAVHCLLNMAPSMRVRPFLGQMTC